MPPLENQHNQPRQLELLSDTVRLPSVATITGRGLEISPSATEGDLLNLGARLFALRAWVKWSLGCLFAEMLKKRPHPDARNHPNEYDTGWVSEFADAHALDPKERREMLGVVTFFGANASPAPHLSYEHHREAMWAADTGEPGAHTRAAQFLRDAEAHALSVTAMRRRIRSAQRIAIPEPTQPDLAGYGVVFDFRRFVARSLSDIDSISQARAQAIISDIGQDTLTILHALQLKAQPR